MIGQTRDPSAIAQMLGLYTGSWRDQSVIYFIVFCLGVGGALIADLRIGLPKATVVVFTVAFSLAMLIAVPGVYTLVERYRQNYLLRGKPRFEYSRRQQIDLSNRRIRVANNIRVRRACLALEKADTLSDILLAFRSVLETEEFALAAIRLKVGGNIGLDKDFIKSKNRVTLLEGTELRGEDLYWSWERGDVEWEELLGSGRYWVLRIPLVTHREWGELELYRTLTRELSLLDMNYYFDLFAPYMSQAVDRVLTAMLEEKSQNRLRVRPFASDSA